MASLGIPSDIIIAILALVGTICGSYFANRKTTALVLYRIDQLEKKVDKHNSVMERTFKLEGWQETAKEQIANLEKELTHEE